MKFLELMLMLMAMTCFVLSNRAYSSTKMDIVNSLLHNFDKFSMPPAVNNQPRNLSIEVYIKSMFDISEYKSSFNVRYYLQLKWMDARLKFEPFTENNETVDKINLPGNFLKDKVFLWDVFIYNEKESDTFRDSGLSMFNSGFSIYSTGLIRFSREVFSNIECSMDLRRFPHDVQHCEMGISSFMHTTSDVQFLLDFLTLGFPLRSSVFELIAITCETSSAKIEDMEYPTAFIKFEMHRKFTFYFYQVFMPTFLAVSCSWLSFWVEIDTGSQISLGVLLLLTIVTINTALGINLPPVSYVKAIDIWMFTGLSFVLCSLLQNAVVNYIGNKRQGKVCEHCTATAEMNGIKNINLQKQKINKICRVMFPVAYLIFNLIYWVYYTVV